MKHHMMMPHPLKMHKMHGHGFGCHKKQHKTMHLLTLIALVTLVAVNVMQLKQMKMKMKRKSKKSGNAMQDKIEHFQHCFERLMEHS